MVEVILIAVGVLGAIGLISALVLFIISKQFAVKEDQRIGLVTEVLPGANCGGCGFPGCGGMAAACVKAADKGSIEGLSCPVGGNECMAKVAAILGLEAEVSAPKTAVVRCNGSCENRPRVVKYDGVINCRIAGTTCQGETLCQYGCLGCGDCTEACQFGAITMNAETGLPEVDREKCTACGACAKACPRNIIEIRQVDESKVGMVVECMNRDKGAKAMKACSVACIGCGRCRQVCGSDAITVTDNLAYIDAAKCTMCRACEEACTRGSIIMLGQPRPAKSVKNTGCAKAEPKSEVKETAARPTNIKPYEGEFRIDYSAPLLPSQQYLLHGTIDLTPDNTQAAGTQVADGKRTNTGSDILLPSQQILLGL